MGYATLTWTPGYCILITFGCVGEGVVMNLDAWENTPEDLRPIIEEVCPKPPTGTPAA